MMTTEQKSELSRATHLLVNKKAARKAKKIFVDLITNDSTLFSYEEVDEIVHMIAMCNKMLNQSSK